MTYRLHQSLGYHLSLAARIQERRLDEGLKQLGLTRITWCVLLAVGNEHMTQPSEIAAFVGIDRTATSRALRGMEADGLIARRSGNSDGRTTEVILTSKGQRLLAEGTPLAEANNAVMAARLGQAGAEQLKHLLGTLSAGEAALKNL